MFNWVFNFFLLFLPSSGEYIFGSIAAFFALDDAFDFLKGSQHLSVIFFLLTPFKAENFRPGFSDLEKLQLKMLNNADAHLQTTFNRHRSLTKVASQAER